LRSSISGPAKGSSSRAAQRCAGVPIHPVFGGGFLRHVEDARQGLAPRVSPSLMEGEAGPDKRLGCGSHQGVHGPYRRAIRAV